MEKPAVLGKLREELLADGDHVHDVEPGREVIQERSGVGRVPDLRRNDERKPPPRLQETRGGDQERRPRRGQPGEDGPERGAQAYGAGAYLALEGLVTDEGRIPRRALETLPRVRRPCEEVPLVDERPRGSLPRRGRGGGLPFDPDTVRAPANEPAGAVTSNASFRARRASWRRRR